MRITQRHLRRLIREMLESDAPELRGPAISVIPWGSRTFVIAYDAELLLSRMQELAGMGINTPNQYVTSWFAPDFSRDPEMIYSGVAVGTPTAAEGPCNGAMHVEGSASRIRRAGWGTAVYMAALDQFGEVGPDRHSVSPSAESQWKSLDRREEVGRHPYDDIKAPRTPDPNDDCTVQRGRDVQVNSSYRLLDEPTLSGLREMRALGDAVQASLGDRWILAEQMLLKLWNVVFQANFGR
jgi:hypothetical protein